MKRRTLSRKNKVRTLVSLFFTEPTGRIELPAFRLPCECSASELRRLVFYLFKKIKIYRILATYSSYLFVSNLSSSSFFAAMAGLLKWSRTGLSISTSSLETAAFRSIGCISPEP